MIPRWLIHELCLGFLEFLFAVYVVVIPLALIGDAYALFRAGPRCAVAIAESFAGRLVGRSWRRAVSPD